MPVLKHAKKKLRQDVKRTRQNKRVKTLYKEMLKKAKANPTTESVSAAFSSIDKAAKNHIIHKNKAARLKASLTKATGNETKASSTEKKSATKKAPVKKATKKKS